MTNTTTRPNSRTSPRISQPRTSQMAFIGRRHLLEKCRVATEAGLDVWLTGENGVGKTALAKRISPDAIYIAHVTPAKELLTSLLMECCQRGWYQAHDKDGEAIECEDSEKTIRRLDQKSATTALVKALDGQKALLILDDFDQATATVVRTCRRVAEVATVVVCSVQARPTQQPFLFQFTHIEVPRLSASESRDLVERLLNEYSIPAGEREKLSRQLLEQAQGLPSVLYELVKRAAGRGEMSVKALRRENLSGHREIDMTPMMVVLAAVLLALRVMTRGLGDHDISVLLGGSGALFMLVRFFAFRLQSKKKR